MKLFQSTILFLALAALASASLNRRGSADYSPASYGDEKAANDSKSDYGEKDGYDKAPSGDDKPSYGGNDNGKEPCGDRKHGPCRPRGGNKDYNAPAPRTPCSSSALPTADVKPSTSCTSGNALPTQEAPKKPDVGADKNTEERVCKTATVTETKTVPTTVVKTEVQTDYKTRTVEKPVPVVEHKTETKTRYTRRLLQRLQPPSARQRRFQSLRPRA